MKNRITFLDGHRGLAIILVLLYHAYARWSDIVPYGEKFSGFPLFKYGWLGVNLFFLISGFVILMSLEKCGGIKEFLSRRWLRLFPAMLICSVIIYATAGSFPERPSGSPTPWSLLPGLTFIEPSWWSALTGYAVKPLEGAFWSLFVEFKFYVFAALIYYWKGRNTLFAFLLSAFALYVLSDVARKHGGGPAVVVLNDLFHTLSFETFSWFASGAAFYVFFKTREFKWWILGLCLAIAGPLGFQQQAAGRLVAATAVSLTFALTMYVPALRVPFDTRVLQFLGYISYPLYLVHENMMIATVIKIGREFAFLPRFVLPFIPIAMLVALAYFIVRYIEPRAHALISRAFVVRIAPAAS
jgi:peptidoglycan/LPS O-acetylase OafA/YrhL